MKNLIVPIMLVSLLLQGCTEKSLFIEKIIDAGAPQNLWLKSTGDLNNDGKTDLIVGGYEKGGVVTYIAPDWTREVIDSTVKASTDAEVIDIDNDKVADLALLTDQALVWLKGPEWKLKTIDNCVLHDIEVNDFDNDGLVDIVARNQAEFGLRGDTLFIYHQRPLGTWSKYKQQIVNGEGFHSVDVNSDGKMDLIVNGYWLENTGDIQSWTAHRFSDTWNWGNTFISAADINNDGRLDILHSPSELMDNYYHISWFEAPEDPSGIWKEHIVVDSIETVVHFIGAADFDLDGKMDVMFSKMIHGKDPDEVVVLLNKDDNVWKKEVISTGGSHTIQLGDFDADGDIDAFGANYTTNLVKMWLNQTKH